jgi:hypothetical protein
VFKGLYEKKVSQSRSIILISLGLVTGLLLFPSEDFSKSLLIGVLFSKDIFSETLSKALFFWSFLFATLAPVFFDLVYRRVKLKS